MISARGLGRDFGAKRVLRGLDFEVPRGGFLLVTGRNGSGKSTLLSLCAGLLAPTAGELDVEVDRGEIGYLAHEPRLLLLDEPYSALDDDAAGLVDALLAEVAGEKTVIVTSHDPERISRFTSEELALG